MSEFQLLVTPKQQTPLSPQLAQGSTIFNQSTTDAVWVSGTPNPQPGNGYKVGGLGSIQWQNTGPAYACVDTGVTNPVSLSVSDHVGQPVNPIDVATATANAINAKGIPNVLLGTMVYGGAYPALGHSFDIPVDFSPYASVNIYLSIPTATNVRVQWVDTPDGVVMSSTPYVVSDTSIGSPTLSLASTVRASTLRIYFSNPSVANISNSVYVFATNRVTAEGMTDYATTYVAQINSQAWANSQMTSFMSAADGFFHCKGGPATLRLSSSLAPATAKGYFGYYYYDNLGVQQNAFVLTSATAATGPNAETEIVGTAYLPAGVLQMFWQNSSTANTYEMKLTLTMGGTS